MSEPTLKLRVYEGIRQLILSGKLQPGQKLAQRDLGETLKVSRNADSRGPGAPGPG
jgi:DNA-binding GntR family transcriptional regulator